MTLIELLMVMSVISILTAILYPVFAQVREAARCSVCGQHVRQLGFAFAMYVQDYDETTPYLWLNGTGRSASSYTWRTMLLPYTKNKGVFFCPSQKLANKWDPGTNEWGFCSYGASFVHYDPGPPTPPWGGATLAAFSTPAETFILTDYDDTGADPLAVTYKQNTHNFLRGVSRTIDQGGSRHQNGANYAFADGHMKWLNIKRRQCDTIGGGDKCPWSLE
jgi:prepilin-type processing-associated H-X9-DG protein/prepilin-type N-terminal cleavage/methylation domain-containing protein